MTPPDKPPAGANDSGAKQPQPAGPPPPPPPPPPPRRGRWILLSIVALALVASLVANAVMYWQYQDYFSAAAGPQERFRSGDRSAKAKIAVIQIYGPIMPPFTERIIKAVEKAGKDDDVKGVLLSIDSPGGLVADSHEIYHALRKLETEQKKPIFVSMKRLAASGGYYVAMGAGEEGTIFAEETTWTGSIGVIIPRYDVSKLAEEWKINVDPLKTGKFKDSLSPFRELSPEEREVWDEILNDAFDRFRGVIAENRKGLDAEGVRKLATGRIFTATQAVDNGLVDRIGFEEDALDALKQKLGLERVRVVTYAHQPALFDLLLGSARAETPEGRWSEWVDLTTPRAMYLCSWLPALPGRVEE